MTNASSQKRPLEGGSGDDGVKRKREHSPATRDWRDVHLNERRPGSERDRDRRRRDDDHYSGRRDRDHRDRDRDRDRSRRHSRERRHHRDDRSRDRDRDRYQRSRTRSPGRSARGITPAVDDEKEEGEISPSALPRRPSPPRHQRELDPPKPPAKAAEAVPTPAPPPVVEESTLSPPPKTEEEILAERRARRAAIVSKYEGSKSVVGTAPGTPTPSVLPNGGTPSGVVNEALARVALNEPGTPTTSVGTPQRASATPPPPSATTDPKVFELAKDAEDEDTTATTATGPEQQINAADYDPSLDRREDERKRFGIDNGLNGKAQQEAIEVDEEEEEVTDDEDEDMDDMFAIAFGDEEEKPKKKKKVKKARPQGAPVEAIPNVVVDSAADPEGYYTVVLGERIDNGRYQVFASLGKGMFANVVRARVLKDENGKDIGEGSGEPLKDVAIKIIRCQESMYKAGLKEAQILQRLRALDPEDKKHVVRLERTFEHRGHLCLVFENLSMNLREVVKRFGKDVGLNIRAVRAYAHQLFIALSLLRKANIMHADIKPDNILVNEQKTMLKLCDLGSASDANENDITPYLVSRFYRAPEIILGVPYDPALDVWSIGCTLYELYTGKILFPGRSNNQMLRLMMELKGKFNMKMIKKAKFGDTYFDSGGLFESIETDKLTGNDINRKIHIQTPTRDLRARLIPAGSARMNDDEHKMLLSFVDLLDKCLMLDPARRITPREALSHPFIRG